MNSIGKSAIALGIIALATSCGDGSMQPGTTQSGSAQTPFETMPTTVETVTSGEAVAQAREMVTQAFGGIADAAAQVDDGSSFEMIEEIAQADTCPAVAPAGDPAVTGVTVAEEDVFSVTEAIDQGMREANTFLLERVLLEQFVESEDGTTVTYLLDPYVVCDQTPGCAQDLTETPLRLRVQSSEGRLYMEVLVGQEQNRGGTIVIGDDIIGAEGNLADLRRVLVEFYEDDPDALVPEILEGVVAASLVRTAAGDYTVTYGITQAARMRYDAGEQEFVDIRYGVSPETMRVRVNGPSNQLSAALNFAVVDASAAGSLFCGSSSNCGPQELEGTFSYHLAGMSGETALNPGDSEISVTNLGLGNEATSVSLNQTALGTLDMNPSSGRHFSMNAKRVEGGTLVTFSPELDVKVAMTLTHLSEGLEMDIPDWLSDEIFDVTLTGESSASVLVPLQNCNGTQTDQVRIESGTLTASATSATTRLDAAAGTCVGAVENPPEDVHAIDRFSAQVCSF